MSNPEARPSRQPSRPARPVVDVPGPGLRRRTFILGALGIGAGLSACSSGETPTPPTPIVPDTSTNGITPPVGSTTESVAPNTDSPTATDSITSSETPSPTETINPRTKEAQATMLRLAELIAAKYTEPGDSLKKKGDGITEYGVDRVYEPEVIDPPYGRKTKAKRIMVETLESESDTPNAQNVKKITFSDQRRTAPLDYNEGWYGDYSVKKYEFIKNEDGSVTIIEHTRRNKANNEPSSKKIPGKEYITTSTEYNSENERQADAFTEALRTVNKNITETLGVPPSSATPTTS